MQANVAVAEVVTTAVTTTITASLPSMDTVNQGLAAAGATLSELPGKVMANMPSMDSAATAASAILSGIVDAVNPVKMLDTINTAAVAAMDSLGIAHAPAATAPVVSATPPAAEKPMTERGAAPDEKTTKAAPEHTAEKPATEQPPVSDEKAKAALKAMDDYANGKGSLKDAQKGQKDFGAYLQEQLDTLGSERENDPKRAALLLAIQQNEKGGELLEKQAKGKSADQLAAKPSEQESLDFKEVLIKLFAAVTGIDISQMQQKQQTQESPAAAKPEAKADAGEQTTKKDSASDKSAGPTTDAPASPAAPKAEPAVAAKPASEETAAATATKISEGLNTIRESAEAQYRAEMKITGDLTEQQKKAVNEKVSVAFSNVEEQVKLGVKATDAVVAENAQIKGKTAKILEMAAADKAPVANEPSAQALNTAAPAKDDAKKPVEAAPKTEQVKTSDTTVKPAPKEKEAKSSSSPETALPATKEPDLTQNLKVIGATLGVNSTIMGGMAAAMQAADKLGISSFKSAYLEVTTGKTLSSPITGAKELPKEGVALPK